MTLNKNNWFAIYYNWIYLSYPKDVCSFFWGSVIAILLFPFILPGKIIGHLSDDYTIERSVVGQALIGIVIYGLLYMIIGLGNIILSAFGYEFLYLWSIILGGFGLGLLFLINLGIIIATVIYIFKVGGKTISHNNAVNNTVDFVAAIKGKYCTKITWKDEK